jgi:spermidine/putrescine transport system substrate-binding protein
MKKLFAVLLVIVMLTASLSVFIGCTPREDTLKILNWAEYIDDEEDTSLLRAFEQYIADTQNGRKVKVKYFTAETNEEMYAKIKNGKRDFDLICPSDYMIAKMAAEKTNKGQPLLKEINFANVPNASNTSPYIENLYSQFDGVDISKYMVGYTWGTMGISYNRAEIKSVMGWDGADADKKVNDLVSSWNALWGKDKNGTALPGLNETITLKNSERDSFFVASAYVNATQKDLTLTQAMANDTSQTNINAVKSALQAQKALSKYWEVDELRLDISVPSKKVTMGLQWAGDAKFSIDDGASKSPAVNLEYSIPDEGSNIFFDGWVVPAYAKNHSLAEEFLNFMCDPDNAAQNMEYVGYTSVIATEEFLDNFAEEDIDAIDVSYFLGQPEGTTFKKVSPVYYPPKSVLDKCFVMLDFGDRLKSVVDMWNTL